MSSLAVVLAMFALVPKRKVICQYAMLLVATILLVSVFMDWWYLFSDSVEPRSDVMAISEELFFPYWFWGGVLSLITVLVMVLGVKQFLSISSEEAKAGSKAGSKKT
jgi:hypothetical protein